MDLDVVFQAMLDDIYAVEASRRQVLGILAWQRLTRAACQYALELDGSAAGTNANFAGSRTHLGWRVTSASIIRALAVQEEEAQARHARHIRKAAEQDELAESEDAEADRCESDAAGHDTKAAAHHAAADRLRAAAAACNDPDEAAAYLAQAAAEADAAAAEESAARDCRAAAARHRRAAAEHREKAAEHRAKAARAMHWMLAARAAREHGITIVQIENTDAFRIGAGLQAAGGTGEVSPYRQYLVGAGTSTTGGAA